MLISIIIPVYNVAPYIEQCLHSVLNQTYKNYEVFVIDDCGCDDSINICHQFIREHNLENLSWRILKHEKNRGLSAARNTGINEANGEYIFFLDSDDSISDNCLESLASWISQDNSIDMVVGNYETNIGKQTAGENTLLEGIYSKDLIHLYLTGQYIVPVWNKLVNLSFVKQNHLYFEEGLIHEDALWSLQAACRMKKMAFSNVVTYKYQIREGSLDHLPNSCVHELNYAIVNAKIGEFISKDSTLKFNIELYQWVEKDRYYRFLTPGWNQHIEVFQSIYQLIRKTHYWNFFDLIFMPFAVITKGALRRSFHKLFPSKYGYIWYVKCYNKYGL